MTHGLVFEELDPENVDALKSLWGQLLRHHQDVGAELGRFGAPLQLEPSWNARRAQYVDWFASEHGRAFVARRGDQLVGYCFVRVTGGSLTWDMGPRVGVLETLVVDAGERGTGVGSELMNRGIQYIRQLGAPTMKVSVVAGNDRAAQLYERLGGIPSLVTYTLKTP